MKRANLIACAVLSILLINPVTTWAGSCPEGQKWHSAWQECVKDRPSLGKKKKSITNKNPAEVETWKFGGAKWFATTTGGIEDSIMGHGDEVKFVLHTDRCIRNPAAVGKYPDDCDRGIFRTQLRSHHSYPMNSDVEYTFSIKDDGVIGKSWESTNGIGSNIFELKPANQVPSFKFYFNTHTRELTPLLLTVCDGAEKQYATTCPSDVHGWRIGKLNSGWNKFRIHTRITNEPNGYLLLYQNEKLIFHHRGRTSYSHRRPINNWIGPYTCCGDSPEGEPTKSYIFRDVSNRSLSSKEIAKIGTIKTQIVASSLAAKGGKEYLFKMFSVSNLEKSNGELLSVSFGLIPLFPSGVADKPYEIQVQLKEMILPSIDFGKMNGCGKKVVRKKKNVSELRLHFLSSSKERATKCAYDLLNSEDKKTIQLLIENIEKIVAIATREDKDADYWQNMAKLISNNSDYLGVKSSSQAAKKISANSALQCKTVSGVVEVETKEECENHWLGELVTE